MAFRRLEAVYVQGMLGSIDRSRTAGFERSALSILMTPVGVEWWRSARAALSIDFAAHVDSQLASGAHATMHPGFRCT